MRTWSDHCAVVAGHCHGDETDGDGARLRCAVGGYMLAFDLFDPVFAGEGGEKARGALVGTA